MSTVPVSLTESRAMYAAAADRAARAWVLIQDLHGMRLCLQREKALEVLGSRIYYDARYDASETYDSLDGFVAELSLEVDASWPERYAGASVPTYVIRPFLSEGLAHLSEMRLGYLTVGAFSKFKGLALERPNFDVLTSLPSGLLAEELQTLAASYQSRTITVINLLRHLSTTFNYVEMGVTRDLPAAMGDAFELPDGDPLPVIKKLQALCELPFLPKPQSYFSSESDRINRLTALPGTPAEVTAALSKY